MNCRARWTGLGAGVLLLALIIAGCAEQNSGLGPDANADAPAEAGGTAALVEGDAELTGSDLADAEAERRATLITGPTTISSPGDYRLANDVEVTQGDGIVITASDVRLWLGERRLYGPGNKVGRGVVIDGARNVKVRGGRIEHFGFGVVLIGASDCRVRNVAIRGGDETADPPSGNPPQIGIMLVNSSMNRISGNWLRGLNLGLFVRGGGSYENHLEWNEVVGGDHGLLAICYNPAPGSDPAGPRADRVRHNLLSRFGIGIVASAQSAENVFALNTIRYFSAAYEDQNGTNIFLHNRTRQITP